MCCHNKVTLPIIFVVAAVNLYFLYRYSGLEYSIATDTEVIIRKLLYIENMLTESTKEIGKE